MTVSVRPERSADRAAIFDVVARAFPTDAEAKLVDRLRDAGAATLSLVAERDGHVVGHLLFSPVRVEPEGAGAGFEALGLAPLAVHPDLQRSGAGHALMRAGLAACREAGHAIVFVLGHADYYPRFGFEPAAPKRLHYSGGRAFDGSFFVAELEPGALAGCSGIVHYHPAFEDT